MNIEYGKVTNAITTETPINRSITGYGSKIPTQYKVQLEGCKLWRRVYCICYSNSGTLYVLVKGKRLFIRDYEIEMSL